MADANDWSDLAGGGDDWSDLAAPTIKRTPGQRFTENDRNATLINPGVAVMREGFVTGTGANADTFGEYLKAQAGSLLAGPLAPARTAAAMLGDVAEMFAPGSQAAIAQGERQRRTDFQTRSEADPWHEAPGGFWGKTQAGAATLGGVIVGGMKDPTNWISPGRTPLGRIAGAAGANAAGDIVTQGADVQAKVQDRYDPAQTAIAAGVGAAIGTASEGARAGLNAIPRPARTAPASPVAGDWSDLAAPQAPGRVEPTPPQAPARQATPANPLVESIRSIASEQGIDPDFAVRVAEIESSLDPKAQNPNSTAGGLYQFIDSTWNGLGGGDKTDPTLSARRFAELTRRNSAQLEQVLGRAPEPWEAYLAHQQGAEGASKLLSNPEARAVDLVGADAVRLNGGNENMTAAEFAGLWRNKYGAAGSSPVRGGTQTASATPETFGEFGPLEPQRTARAPGGEQPDLSLGSIFDEPARPADRQAAVGAATEAPGASLRQPAGPAADGRFIDPQHARLYELGQEALQGRINRDLAIQLSRTMARDMDWSDLGLSPRERQAFRQDGTIFPRRMAEVAKAFAQDVDAPHNRGYLVSLYDTDRYRDVMARNAVAGRPPEVGALPTRQVSPARNPLAVLPQADPSRRAMLTGQRPPQMPAEAPGSARRAAIDLSRYGEALNASRPPTGGGLRGALRSAAAPMGQGSPDYRGQTISGLAARLRQAIGVTQRQGRLTLKRAAGEFDPRSGIVRTRKSLHALQELAHEAFHHLEHVGKPTRVLAATRAYENELRGMAYEGANPAHIREEGFAEFGRLYVTNPDYARQNAPNFFHAFEEALAQDNPALLRELQAVQAEYRAILQGEALKVGAASVAYTGKPGPITAARKALQESGVKGVVLQALDEAYRGIYDRRHPFNIWVREVQKLARANTGKRMEMEAASNPYVLARQADHAFAMGQSDIIHGVTPYHGVDPEGPSIKDVYREAFGKREPTEEEDAEFAAYLISRRMRHEWDRFARGELENEPDKPEFDKAHHEQRVADAEKLHPEWVKAAEMATEWNRNHWRLEFEGGFITKSAYEAGIKNHPDYVPLMRDMSDRSAPGKSGRPRGTLQFAGGVDAFEGSARDIIHPLVSMARRAYELRAAMARNEVVGAMRNAAEKAGDNTGALLEVLPAKQMEAIEVDAVAALKAVAKALGLDERDRSTFEVFQTTEYEGLVKATLFRQTDIVPRRDESVVFHWRGGEKTPLLMPEGKFGRDLVEALGGMTKDTRTLWEEVAAGASQALRVGVTGMPEFAIKTSLRDQLAAAILTDVGFVPFKDSVRGLADELGGSQAAKRYLAAGGLKGGINVAAMRKPFPKNDLEAKAKLHQYRRQGFKVRDARELFSTAAHLVDIGDTATRIGVFRKALEKAKARGLSDYEAVTEARHVSADFFDPTRHGAWPGVVQVARAVPFFNSGLQGTDVLVRTVRHAFAKPETMGDARQFKKAWRAMALLSATAVLGATIVAANYEDPDFQNLNDHIRGTHWPLWKRGNGEWVLYPKSFELGMPSNLVERALNWMLTSDPKTLERIGKDMANTMLPTRDATALAVPFQAASNRDYNGRPIVPEHLRGTVEPKYQANVWTSEIAKRLAGNVVSPAVLEYYITGMFGTAGRDALTAGDNVIRRAEGKPEIQGRAPDMYITRGFVRRTARGSDAETNFWKLVSRTGKWAKNVGTVRLMVREGQTAEAQAYIAKLEPAAKGYVVSEALLGTEFTTFNPLARAQRASGVLSEIRRENREGTLSLGAEVIRLSPRERRVVDDALDDLALAQINNAQVRAGVRGWENRPLIEREEPADYLRSVDPRVERAVTARLLEEKVLPAAPSAQAWDKLRTVPENLSAEQLGALVTMKRLATTETQMRTLRQEVGRRGQPTQAGDWSDLGR